MQVIMNWYKLEKFTSGNNWIFILQYEWTKKSNFHLVFLISIGDRWPPFPRGDGMNHGTNERAYH